MAAKPGPPSINRFPFALASPGRKIGGSRSARRAPTFPWTRRDLETARQRKLQQCRIRRDGSRLGRRAERPNRKIQEIASPESWLTALCAVATIKGNSPVGRSLKTFLGRSDTWLITVGLTRSQGGAKTDGSVMRWWGWDGLPSRRCSPASPTRRETPRWQPSSRTTRRRAGRSPRGMASTHTYDYDHYDECLQSGEVDAVYLAVPNHLHREYAERAARAGVHVLCEKPLADNEEDGQRDGASLCRSRRQTHGRLSIAPARVPPDRHRGGPVRAAGRAARVHIPFRGTDPCGGRAAAEGRRAAGVHRRLLPERRPPPVRGRARGGVSVGRVGWLGPLPRGRGNGVRDPAVPARPSGHFHLRFQCLRTAPTSA